MDSHWCDDELKVQEQELLKETTTPFQYGVLYFDIYSISIA